MSEGMDPFELVDLGRTGLKVTRLGLGGAPLGNPPPTLSDLEAVETVRQAVSLGMGYVDTAAYGEGRSELRYGEALKDFSRDSYVISTKVGVLLKLDGVHEVDFGAIGLANLPALDGVFDFSRDAVLRSLEQSLQRLRLEHVDILLLHVVPREHYRTAIEEGFPTLAELRSQGVVRAIGAGLTPLDLLLRFAREADFDCFLLPERYPDSPPDMVGSCLECFQWVSGCRPGVTHDMIGHRTGSRVPSLRVSAAVRCQLWLFSGQTRHGPAWQLGRVAYKPMLQAGSPMLDTARQPAPISSAAP